MGKYTLFHPVSLNILRGAAEWHGFKLTRINQTILKADRSGARYRVELEVPTILLKDSVSSIKDCLQSCFMSDVSVLGLWHTKTGKYVADIETRIP